MSTSNSAKITRVHEAIKFLRDNLSQTASGMDTASGTTKGTIEYLLENNSKPGTKNLELLERLAYTPYKWAKGSEIDSSDDDCLKKEFINCIERKLNSEKDINNDTSKNTDNRVWKEHVSNFVEKFWDEIFTNLPNEFLPFINLRNLASQIISQRSFIKPLGMKYGVEIESIYQEIPVLHFSQESNEEISEEEVTKWIVNKLCSPHTTKLIVTGELGSGKTTMLLRIAKRISKRIDYLPIFFRFRRYAETLKENLTSSIIDFVVNDYFEEKLKEDFVKNLRLGKIIMIIDGLDEVSHSEFPVAYLTLTQFIQKFNNTNLVVSSRNEESWKNKNDHDWLNTFEVIEIDGLDEAAITKFVYKFFKFFKAEYTDLEIINIQQRLRDFLTIASNPLTLTFVCIALMSHKKDSNFDNYLDSLNKWDLIERCIYHILEEWNEVKDKDSIFENLSFEGKQLYLGNLALKAHETNAYFFTWKRLRDFNYEFFSNYRYLNTVKNIRDNFLLSERIIDDLEKQQSLFVKKADQQYGFTNKMLRLWFTAITIRKKYSTLKSYLNSSFNSGEEKASLQELKEAYYEIYPDEARDCQVKCVKSRS